MDSGHVGARILIIDDDRSTTKALQYALDGQGYETRAVYSGEAATKTISVWHPDLVMLDVRLPDIDGLELLSRLRAEEETAATPVILITASRIGSSSRVEGLNLGADDYIEKPFGLDELLARVSANLRAGRLMRQLEEMTKRLADLASRDSLTGLYHHGKIMEKLSMELYRTTRYDVDVSCVMIDLDKFKSINDTFGHQTGDDVLIAVARLLTACCRLTDSVGRYGGEEFLVVFPHTPEAAAFRKADDLRMRLAALEIDALPADRRVTASFGVAAAQPSDRLDAAVLVKRADAALLHAKSAGGNNVTQWEP
jgi:two-component system cell cycle response regulator